MYLFEEIFVCIIDTGRRWKLLCSYYSIWDFAVLNPSGLGTGMTQLDIYKDIIRVNTKQIGSSDALKHSFIMISG